MAASLPAPIRTAIEGLLRHALGQSPNAQKQLGQLIGRPLDVHCLAPPVAVRLTANLQGIGLEAVEGPSAPARVQFSNPDLLRTLVTAEPPLAALHAQGDVELASDWQRLLTELDLDWEALLALGVGDIGAHQLGRGLRAGWRWLRQHRERTDFILREYLHEETAPLVTGAAAETFFSTVDAVQLQTDRLEARLAALREALEPAQP
ncbi:MAG: hypothetical protein SV583_07575 [Pseudomonadota bacterium]|nr:hypothetical protein [Pseudomonadota bacterium]